jgi:hypothetical protein
MTIRSLLSVLLLALISSDLHSGFFTHALVSGDYENEKRKMQMEKEKKDKAQKLI